MLSYIAIYLSMQLSDACHTYLISQPNAVWTVFLQVAWIVFPGQALYYKTNNHWRGSHFFQRVHTSIYVLSYVAS